MRRIPGERLVAAGGAIAGLGGAGVVGYYLYVLGAPDREFWRLPGIVSVAVLTVGLLMLAWGLLRDDQAKPVVSQRQRGGDNSTNVQAGRDVRQSDKNPPSAR